MKKSINQEKAKLSSRFDNECLCFLLLYLLITLVKLSCFLFRLEQAATAETEKKQVLTNSNERMKMMMIDDEGPV
jgi:hypothetical protein